MNTVERPNTDRRSTVFTLDVFGSPMRPKRFHQSDHSRITGGMAGDPHRRKDANAVALEQAPPTAQSYFLGISRARNQLVSLLRR